MADITLRENPGRWQFILGPATGGWKWNLANAKSRKASFKLRDNSTASFNIRGTDPLAGHIDELATDLHLLRRNRAGVVEQLYRGRVGGVGDELSASGHVVSVPTLDYRAVLERRILASGSQVTWTTADRFDIAFGLITQAQNKTGGDYGIANGAGLSGKTATMTFELGDSIGQKIQEFSASETGFDWDILPMGQSGLTFMAWPQRGTSHGVILQYGAAAVTSITRAVDSGEYANMVRVSGQPPEGSSTPPATYEGLATGITDPLLYPQGRWDKSFGTSLTTSPAVSDRKDWLLDDHQVIRPSYTVKLAPNFWDGPSHIWLGDPVRLVIQSGRLAVDTTLRVLEIDVEIADTGQESVSLTVGAPRPDYARRAAANEKRIDELERR